VSTGTESIITPDGHRRILNLEPSDPKKVARYASAAPPLEIPLSEIQPFNAWPSQIAIKDQDGAGACNGHAAATAMELSRFMQGMPHVPLSAWWVYGKLVKGWDRGSNIMDALELCQADGVAPESEVKYGDYSGRYTDQAASAAKRFKLKIGRQLKTWEEIVTAVALRRGVNLAVRATMGWQSGNLDADGCPPVGRGPANHAVAVGGAVKKLQNGELAILDPNSWGTRWGQKGFCWLKRAHIESASWFEAYEVVAVSDDPTDPTPPAP
jgi:C1A family cysteine protease